MNDFKAMVAGIQLENGLDSASRIIAEALFAAGAEIAVDKDYLSTIYGGKSGTSYYQIRAGDEPLYCVGDDTCDALICLDISRSAGVLPLSAKNYASKVKPDGLVLYDTAVAGYIPSFDREDINFCGIPAQKLAAELFPNELPAKINLIRNSIFIGVLFSLLPMDPENKSTSVARALTKVFSRKKAAKDQNCRAFEVGFYYGTTLHLPYRLPSLNIQPQNKRIFLTGNDALGLGTLAAGVKTYFGYPITPASSLLEFMKKHLKAAIQTEDEIAASAMTLGASFAGGRSLTATSGPGLCLMVENITHAGMIEQGIVIINAQRAGPSTGMPTKTEQSDLDLVIYGNNGEIPKIVLAPGDVAECFQIMPRAYTLARKYQLPVIVLSSLELSEGIFTTQCFDLDAIPAILPWPADKKGVDPNALAERFSKRTASGISPKNIPGKPGEIFKVNGAEHDEFGFVNANPIQRVQMMDKRMKKLEVFLKEDAQPPKVYGDPDARIALVGWGATKGALLEAAERLNERGIITKTLHFTDIWPLPVEKIKDLLKPADHIFVAELNKTGQFAQLLIQKFAEAGILLKLHKINRYDGRPLEPRLVAEKVLTFVEEVD